MTTVVNPPQTDNSGNMMGFVFGAIFLVVVIFLFFYYGLPALRGGGGGGQQQASQQQNPSSDSDSGIQVDVPEKVEVDVNGQ